MNDPLREAHTAAAPWRPGPMRLAIAVLALAPLAAHAFERGGQDLWPLLLALTAPALIGRRDLERVFGATVALVFLVPMAPVFLRVLPFLSERAVVLGAVAWIALAVPWPAPSDAAGPRRARLLLGLFAAWSVGAALRGFLLAGTPPADWWSEILGRLPGRLLVPRPQVEPGHAAATLAVRLEFLAAAWMGLELAARRPRVIGHMAGWFALALVLGLLVAVVDLWNGSDIRGESFLARMARGIPRNHRPLVDNNALGSALVVGLPIVLGALVARYVDRGRPGPGLPSLAAAAACGALLLVTSRSKAAVAAAFLGLGVWIVARFGLRRSLRRPAVATALALALSGLIGAQLLPEAWVERISANRYGADMMRVARLDVAGDYLRANRIGPWLASISAGAAAPLFGHGLGSLPLRMEQYRDAALRTDFNPLSENGHNQFLQAFAEEGAIGALGFAAVFALASAGAWARLRLLRVEDRAEAWLVAGVAVVPVALFVNLQVGHSLLETSPAIWAGAALGLGAGLVPPREGQRRARLARPALLWTAAALLGASGLLWQERVGQERTSLGAYPWIPRQGPGPGADRLLATDARFFVRWGEGDRMLLAVLDPRPFMFEEPMRLTIELDRQPALSGAVLSRPPDASAPLPGDLLKLDRPPHVSPGDLVEVRVRSEPLFSEAFYGSTGRDWIGPRIGRPVFIDRR